MNVTLLSGDIVFFSQSGARPEVKVVVDKTAPEMIVMGKGNYKFQTGVKYNIVGKDISKMQIKAGKYSYDGGAVEFNADDIAAGKLIITNRAIVTIKGIGNYGGTKSVRFSIVAQKVEKN